MNLAASNIRYLKNTLYCVDIPIIRKMSINYVFNCVHYSVHNHNNQLFRNLVIITNRHTRIDNLVINQALLLFPTNIYCVLFSSFNEKYADWPHSKFMNDILNGKNINSLV